MPAMNVLSQNYSESAVYSLFLRVATVRENYLENEIFFQVREKSGNFVDGQGNLERTWKVREKSGNLKKKRLWQAVFRKFILFKRVKDVLSQR